MTSADWVVDLASGGQLTGSLTRSDPGSDTWSAEVAVPPNYTNDYVAHIVSLSARAGDGSTNSGVVGNIDQEGQPQFDQAPYVSLTSVTPTELPAAGGPVTIVAAADDDRSVSEVYAVVTGPDGPQTIALVAGPGGYEATFEAPANPSRSGPVTYTVSVTAVDDIGQSASADGPAITVAAVPNAAPEVVSATATPALLTAAGGPVTIRATATDPDGTLSSVVATVTGPGGGTAAVPLSATATDGLYEGTWTAPPNPTDTARSYAVSVTATDGDGATDTADAETVVVAATPSNAAPVVVGASATPTSLATSGGPVTLRATATDTDGDVAAVLATVTGPGGDTVEVPLPATVTDGLYEGTWTAPPNPTGTARSYAVSVTATDDRGATATRSAGSVSVAAAPPPDLVPELSDASTTPPSLPTSSGTVEVSATATDDGTVEAVRAVVTDPEGGQVEVALAAGSGDRWSGDLTLPANTRFARARYDVDVVAIDDAGQETSGPAGRVVVAERVDTAPRVGGGSVSTSGRIQVTISDDRGLAEAYAVVTSSGAPTSRVALYAAAGSSAYEGQFAAPGPGTYAVQVVARDGAGQVTRVGIGSLTVPPAPPTSAVVTVSDDRLRFGRVSLGRAERASVTLTNCGTRAVRVDLSVLGRRFDLVGPATLRLGAGESRRVTVELTPRRRGMVTGQLVLAPSGSPSLAVELVGRGSR